MSRFNEMLRELIEDVQKFLVVTLNTEILTTNALSRKECLLMKIQHIRQEYPQLQMLTTSKQSTPILGGSLRGSRQQLHLKTETVVPLTGNPSSPSSPQPYLDMQSGSGQSSKEPSPVFDQKIIIPIGPEMEEVYEVYESDRIEEIAETETKSEAKSFTENENLPLEDVKRDIPDISAADLAKSEKNGFLEKKGRERLGGLFSPFQRRWCAIKSGVFYFFDNANDRRPKGQIDLTGYEARASPTACKDISKKTLCFEIVCPGQKTYQFIALTVKDMKQWMAAIERNSKSLNSRESNIKSIQSDIESSPMLPPSRMPALSEMGLPNKNSLPLPLPPLEPNEIIEDIYEALDHDDDEDEEDEELIYEMGDNIEETDEVYVDVDTDEELETKNDNFKPEDWYVALWDCSITEEEELPFLRGDMIKIISKEFDGDAWWTGQLGSKTGLVPKAFLMEAYEKV